MKTFKFFLYLVNYLFWYCSIFIIPGICENWWLTLITLPLAVMAQDDLEFKINKL